MKLFFLNKLDYEIWANEAIISSMSNLQNEDNRCNFLLSHILAARVVWLERIKDETTTKAIWTSQSFDACKTLNIDIDTQYSKYLTSLDDKDFQTTIPYKNLKQEQFSNTLAEIIHHVFNHSSYHRGQIVSRLKELGAPIPITDYIVFSRS